MNIPMLNVKVLMVILVTKFYDVVKAVNKDERTAGLEMDAQVDALVQFHKRWLTSMHQYYAHAKAPKKWCEVYVKHYRI